SRFRKKALIDVDPGYMQAWYLQGGRNFDLTRYDAHFTIAGNLGTAGCSIPTCGIRWRRTRQPVVLDDWPVTRAADADRFTTVASWRGGYGRVEYNGRSYGLKAHEWRRFADIPMRVDATFEAALAIDSADAADRERLDLCGWALVDPTKVAGDA